jgi:radical SAM superfamily enzyme
MKECENCGSRMGHHGCTWCNEESYIVDQYYEMEMELPSEDTEFMKKYDEQQKSLKSKKYEND